MIKAILFDADGVMINKPMLFSEHLVNDFGIPMEKILPFFKNEFQSCLVGKADLKEELKKYVEVWGWNKSIDQLLEYWFSKENYIDQRMVDLVKGFRQQGIKCYLCSNQEKYRTEYMKNDMGLSPLFDSVFSSAYLGVKKPDMVYWQEVFEKIQPVNKNEVMVWDDDQETVDSAKEFGLEANFYTDHNYFVETMGKIAL